VVSTICTTYTHEKFIEQCIDGFLMQETTPVEIITHNDAFPDRPADIILASFAPPCRQKTK
jgi:glycosyltransferase involved in cell wall biosynthesis